MGGGERAGLGGRGVVAGRRAARGRTARPPPGRRRPEPRPRPLPLLCGRPSQRCSGLGALAGGGRLPGSELLLGGGEAGFLSPPVSQVGSALSGPTRSPGSCISRWLARESSERAVPAPVPPAPPARCAPGSKLQGAGDGVYSFFPLQFFLALLPYTQPGLAISFPLKRSLGCRKFIWKINSRRGICFRGKEVLDFPLIFISLLID